MPNTARPRRPRAEHSGPGIGRTASDSDRIPACTQCGERQPADGRPAMEDGTPISAQEYLAVAGLVADALVCGACVPALATGDHWTGIEWSSSAEFDLPKRRGS